LLAFSKLQESLVLPPPKRDLQLGNGCRTYGARAAHLVDGIAKKPVLCLQESSATGGSAAQQHARMSLGEGDESKRSSRVGGGQ
jgi:hypothetical protein